MNLRGTLRRAAEVFVSLPDEVEEEHHAKVVSLSNSRGTATDALWAELEEDASRGKSALPTKSVEQIVRDAQGPNLDEIHVSADTPPPAANSDGKMDFSAIYQKAGLPSSPFSAEQTIEMIAALPAELPLESRRQTVRVMINSMGKAIGASLETVIADASRKLAALTAYSESVEKQTGSMLKNAEADIAALQAQIQEKRNSMTQAEQLHSQVTQVCLLESHRLEEVLHFFSTDTPPSSSTP